MSQRDAKTTLPADEYLEADLQRILTENPDIAEQGITVVRRDHSLVLYGEVESDQRREEIVRRVTERFPGVPILADIGLIRTQEPSEIEELP
ncbi:hypothetical protein AB0J86_13780 [Micromonospora sp. NPDC049559]|uniref:hypothetical protein n=1 Tax=Micromonospora sp. NPDC049559 TaxID=3155923 RepID=UPI00342B83D8